MNMAVRGMLVLALTLISFGSGTAHSQMNRESTASLGSLREMAAQHEAFLAAKNSEAIARTASALSEKLRERSSLLPVLVLLDKAKALNALGRPIEAREVEASARSQTAGWLLNTHQELTREVTVAKESGLISKVPHLEREAAAVQQVGDEGVPEEYFGVEASKALRVADEKRQRYRKGALRLQEMGAFLSAEWRFSQADHAEKEYREARTEVASC